MIHYFIIKKTAADTYRILQDAYGERGPSQTTCNEWFRRFKNGDFDPKDKERTGQPKKFEDNELQVLLDEDSSQTQSQLAEQLGVTQQIVSVRLKAMGKILKEGKWLPHKLDERQMENRKTISEFLLQRNERKSFLHRIVTGDEKWIYFENPKRKKSYVNPGQPAKSSAKPNRFGKKRMLCVWWDQKGVVYYELLKPGETVNTDRYKQQIIDLNLALIKNRPEWANRHDSVIFLHDNAPAHKAKPVLDTLKSLGWDLLPHPPYSPDLAPSDYHLFASMGHALKDTHFKTSEDLEDWVSDWFSSKDPDFYWRWIHKLPERWTNCVASDGNYFE